MGSMRGVVTRLAEQSAHALTRVCPAQDLLRELGLNNPAIWDSYGLGTGDATVGADLSDPERKVLVKHGLIVNKVGLVIARPGGVNIPMSDPSTPTEVAGFARINRAQHKHAFVGAPVGVGCPRDIGTPDRVVLADGPLIGLALANAGVPAVLLVEDARTLPSMASWFSGRQILVAGHRRRRINEIIATIQHWGQIASPLTITYELADSPRASLDLLGLDVEILRSGEERPPITPLLLRALHDHSRGRLADGDAIAALKALEADQADFIAQYGIGYLSATYADALAREAKRAFSGLRLGEALILPALDDQGAIVDILVIHSYVGGHILPSLFSEPRGILAPHLAAGCSELWITDTFRWLARMMRQGLRDTLLLRGPADAVNNAKRLASMGVRRIHGFLRRDADAIAAALHAAGIEIGTISRQGPGDESQAIEVRPHPAGAKSATASLSSAQALPPMPPVPVPNSSAPDATGIESALRQVQLDAPNEWHFEVGALRISIDRRTDGESTRDIVLRANQKVAQDRFDLAIDVQRQRFASGAALKIGLPESILLVHLSDLLAAVQRIESEQASGPAVVVSTAERSEAETLLRASDLTNRIAADLTAMGWIGDDDTKILLYLTGVSRLLPRPLWALYQASGGAAPWRELGLIASLTPPEFRLVLPRVSESLLLHAQARRRSLAHHLLLIDQAETLRPEPALALRVLSERGGIGWATLDPAAMGADLVAEARGPVSVLAAASGDIDRRCRDCFLSLQCDESPEQTAKILAAQRVGTTGLPILGILARHHALQRLLRPATVQIPFRDRIMFPNARVRHRADHARFLVLIAASALLHQAQRTRDHDAIVADEADFRLAARLASQFVAASDAGLSSQASLFLQRLPAATESFTTATVPGLFPEWTRWTSRAVLQELVDGGYLAANGGGRGKERRFQLRRRSQLAQRDQIGLRAVGTIVSEVGGLAEVGGSDSANVSPCGSVG